MKKIFLVGILMVCAFIYPVDCLAQDGIKINIVAGPDKARSGVTASGQVFHVITDKESKSFKLDGDRLYDAVKAYWGKKPNDAWLSSPGKGRDLYTQYNWPQVQTVLKVKSATITGITSTPSIIASRTFTNNSSKKATFKASISEQIKDTVTSSWSETNKLEIKQKFNYGVAIQGETSINYTRTWGQSGSETKSSTVSSAEEVTVELEPNESVIAYLTASKGVMRVRIVYEASLTGIVATNYNPTHKGHHFWDLPIKNVMQAAKLPTVMEFTEDIEVGYYSNGQLEIKNAKGALMHSAKARIKR